MLRSVAMSRSVHGIRSNVVLGIVFLVTASARADDKQPPRNTVENGRVAARHAQSRVPDEFASGR